MAARWAGDELVLDDVDPDFDLGAVHGVDKERELHFLWGPGPLTIDDMARCSRQTRDRSTD